MTAHHYWYFAALFGVMIGWDVRACADDNVTIYGAGSSSSASTTASSSTSADGTPATHKPLHHHHKATSDTTAAAGAGTGTGADSGSGPAKKTAKTAKTSSKTSKKKVAGTSGGTVPGSSTGFSSVSAPLPVPPPTIVVQTAGSHGVGQVSLPPSTLPPASVSSTGPITVTAPAGAARAPSQISLSAPLPAATDSDKPQVETGLPVARPGSKTYASPFPLPPVIPVSATASSYGDKGLLENFSFTNFSRRPKNTYPWKTRIYTTKFWIGESGTTISATDNIGSAWDENWRQSNYGTDTPNDRDEYAPAHHIAGVNPFYVALPFNDLAFPDKARRWLPAGWYRPPRGGKQVSACKDRWVEIKNAQGDICYAQWEDVGPLRYDHAEYVFGDERPDTYTRAGLDVSPAVFEYLGLDEKKLNLTSWRFVDDADVQPGAWLKYDEEVLLLKAIRANGDKDILPIERARAPISDPDDIDSSQKKLNKAKG